VSREGVRRLLLAVLWLLAFVGPAQSATGSSLPDAMDVRSAEATLEPDGLPVQVRQVQLPFRWDHEFPPPCPLADRRRC
jgi:hypothetical protein